MRNTKGLGYSSVDGEPGEDIMSFVSRKADALHEDTPQRLHGTELVDEGPFARAPGHMFQQCRAHRCQVGRISGHHQDWQAKLATEFAHVDDVEPGQRNALEHDQLNMPGIFGTANQAHQLPCCIYPVLSDTTDQDPVQSRPGKDGTHYLHVAAVMLGERRVIEADDIGEMFSPGHGLGKVDESGVALKPAKTNAHANEYSGERQE